MYVLGSSGSTHKKVIQLQDSSSFDKRRKGKEKKIKQSPTIVPAITAKLSQISAVYENSILCFQICA